MAQHGPKASGKNNKKTKANRAGSPSTSDLGEGSSGTKSGKKLKTGNVQESVDITNIVPGDSGFRAGRIKKVELTNFMGFDKRTFELGPHINFVIGPNGSGKSTLAAAISVACGARACATNRAQSLKEYIKKDCREGTIRLHLTNRGDNAYMPDEWGDTIIVERRLTEKGADGYRIVNDPTSPSMRKQERKKQSDLKHILDKLFVQIDNPVYYLRQNLVAEFMKFTPEQLYKFFNQALGMDTLKMGFDETKHDVVIMKASLVRKQTELKSQEDELGDWKERLRATVRHDAPEDCDSGQQLEQELSVWHAKTLSDQIAKWQKERDKSQVLLEAAKENTFDENQQEDISMSEDMESVDSENLPTLKKQFRTEKGNLADTRKTRGNLEKSLKEHKDIIQSCSREKLARESTLKQLTEQIETIANKKSEEGDLRLEFASLQNEIDECIRVTDGLTNKLKEVNKRVAGIPKLRLDLASVVQNILDTEVELTSAKVVVADSANGLGASWKRLSAAIVKAKFSRPPIGPIVNYVTVTSEMFAVVADEALSSVLEAYLMQDDEDVEKFCAICKELGIDSPPIFLEAINSRSPACECPRKYNLLGDVLNVADTRVEQFLESVVGIDRIIILTDGSDPYKALFTDPPLTNVDKVYDLSGCAHAKKHGYYEIMPPSGRSRILSPPDQNEKIKLLEAKLGEQKQQRDELQIAIGAHKTSKDTASENQTQLKEQKKELARLKRRQDAVSSFLDAIATSTSNDCRRKALNDGLAELIEKLIEHKLSLPELERALCEQKTLEKKQDTNIKKLEKEIRRLGAFSNKKKTRMGKRAQNDVQKKVKALEAKIKTFTNKIDELTTNYKEAIEVLEAGVSAIEKFENCRSYEEIKADQDALRAAEMARTVSSDSFSSDQCQRKIEEITKKLQINKKLVDEAEKAYKFSETCHQERIGYLQTAMQRLQERAADQCKMILKERKFDGELVFDSVNEKLHYTVKNTSDTSYGAGASLSGGERTYAAVALISAFWDEQVPFRILDECEMFMDSMCRNAALITLVQKAHDQNVQAIFLTPSNVDLDNIIKEAKLPQEKFTKISMAHTGNR